MGCNDTWADFEDEIEKLFEKIDRGFIETNGRISTISTGQSNPFLNQDVMKHLVNNYFKNLSILEMKNFRSTNQLALEIGSETFYSKIGIITFHMRAKSSENLLNTEFPNPLLKRNSKYIVRDSGKWNLDADPSIFRTMCFSGTAEAGKSVDEFWSELDSKEPEASYYITQNLSIRQEFSEAFVKYAPFITDLYVDEVEHFEYLRKKKKLMPYFKNLTKISFTNSRSPKNKEEAFPASIVKFIKKLPEPQKLEVIEINRVSFTERNLEVFPRILFEEVPDIKELIYRCPEPEGFYLDPKTAAEFLKRDKRIKLLGGYEWNESEQSEGLTEVEVNVNAETERSGDGITIECKYITTFEPGEEKRHQGYPHFKIVGFVKLGQVSLFEKLVQHLSPWAKSIVFCIDGSPKEIVEIFKAQEWKSLINLRVGDWKNDHFEWLKSNAPLLESFHLQMAFKYLFADCPHPIVRYHKIQMIFGTGFQKLKNLHLQDQLFGKLITQPILNWLKTRFDNVTYSDPAIWMKTIIKRHLNSMRAQAQ